MIDFYQGEAREMSDGSPAASSFYLDVRYALASALSRPDDAHCGVCCRPALDSVESAFDRIRMGLHSTFPSVFARESTKEKDLK